MLKANGSPHWHAFLTGTPAPNYAKEMYALMHHRRLDGMSYPRRRSATSNGGTTRFSPADDTGTSASSGSLCRRTFCAGKPVSTAALPAEINVFVNLQCPTRRLQQLQKRREKLQQELRDADLRDGERERKAAALKNLRSEQLRVCGRGKRNAVGRYLKQYLEDHPHGAPFVVFAYHKCMFEALDELLRQESVSFGNGDTPDADRGAAAERRRVAGAGAESHHDHGVKLAGVRYACRRTAVEFRGDAASHDAHRAAGSAFARVKHVWLFGATGAEVYDKLCRKRRGWRRL